MREWTHDWEHKINIITEKGNVRKETNLAYEYFCFFRNCGSIAETARHFEKNDNYMRQIATKYRWQERLSEKKEYDNQIAEEELTKERNKFLSNIKKEVEEDNQALRRAEQDVLIQLGYIKNPKTKKYEPNHDVDKLKLLKTLSDIQKSLSTNRKDMYRAYGLPDKINDKQIIDADVSAVNEVTMLDKKTREELDQEYEDRFKQYLNHISEDDGANV